MTKLRDICTVTIGVAPLFAPQAGSRFVRLADLSDLRARRAPELLTGSAPAVARAIPIEAGDILVSARGTSTDTALATPALDGAFVTLDLFLLRPDRGKVEPSYLLAVLEQPEVQSALAMTKQGSSLPRLPRESLEAVPIPLPNRRTQQQIASLAECLRAERTLLAALISARDRYARQLVRQAINKATDQ